ncbi:MAG: glutamate racemase [Ruminococcaceae bacterium]|nr:glutamate racemase [Oscillospiraceae bacterium]
MNIDQCPIGVFDSGLGGISVLKELSRLMPSENYIYFGDTKNAPYGDKTDEEIRELSEKCLEFLVSKGVKAIVIACNTATSVSADYLRKKYDIPIVGIEPALKPAASNHPDGNILIMATPVTLKKDKFASLNAKYGNNAKITPLPCPGLAEIIEKGCIDKDEIKTYLKNLFKPYESKKISAIVLGCTHYPHIENEIRESFDYDVKIYDGSLGTAKETLRRLDEVGILNKSENHGTVEFFSSESGNEETEIMKKFFSI